MTVCLPVSVCLSYLIVSVGQGLDGNTPGTKSHHDTSAQPQHLERCGSATNTAPGLVTSGRLLNGSWSWCGCARWCDNYGLWLWSSSSFEQSRYVNNCSEENKASRGNSAFSNTVLLANWTVCHKGLNFFQHITAHSWSFHLACNVLGKDPLLTRMRTRHCHYMQRCPDFLIVVLVSTFNIPRFCTHLYWSANLGFSATSISPQTHWAQGCAMEALLGATFPPYQGSLQHDVSLERPDKNKGGINH